MGMAITDYVQHKGRKLQIMSIDYSNSVPLDESLGQKGFSIYNELPNFWFDNDRDATKVEYEPLFIISEIWKFHCFYIENIGIPKCVASALWYFKSSMWVFQVLQCRMRGMQLWVIGSSSGHDYVSSG